MSQHSGHLGTKPILGLFFGMAAPIAVGHDGTWSLQCR